MNPPPVERCRLVLVTPAETAVDDLADRLARAGVGGDIASVIVPAYGGAEDAYQALLEAVVPVCRAFGAAVIAAGSARIAARAGADGLHLRGGPAEVAEAVDAHAGRSIIGAEAGATRHGALEIGETRPDYVFFGRPGADTHAEAHPKSLEMAQWWAEFVEIPAVLMAGSALDRLGAAAATGVEFVALSRAVLGPDADPADAVRRANAILEDHPLEVAA